MSQFSNLATSLLMSLPLVAVPCLAIFGIPTSDASSVTQKNEGIALGDPSGQQNSSHGSSLGSASLGEASIEFQDRSDNAACEHEGCDHEHAAAGETSFGTGHDGHDHGAAQTEYVSANTGSAASGGAVTSGQHETAANASLGIASDQHASDPGAEFHEAAGGDDAPGVSNPSENPFGVDDAPPAGEKADSSPPGTDAADPAWTEAIDRLKELGVDRFHLTNGEAGGKFFFSCSMRTSRNVLQRFEAEATTPAAAAGDVLAQVETWKRTR